MFFRIAMLASISLTACGGTIEFGEDIPGRMQEEPAEPPKPMYGAVHPCEGADWSWVNSDYRHYTDGYVPGRGAGLKNAELSAGGEYDQYWSYMQFLLPELDGVTLSTLDLILMVRPDGDPRRVPTNMELLAVVQPWKTEELAPGYTGIHWEHRPAVVPVADVPAPAADQPYVLDLLPVFMSTGLKNGFALRPINTTAHMNHFDSCSGSWKPLLRWAGTK
jgi:hypothetical protein